MTTRTSRRVKAKKAKGRSQPKVRRSKAVRYQVVLREGGQTTITAEVEDRLLYPRALAWNRLLSSDRGRQIDEDQEARTWRQSAHKAILDLAAAGLVSRQKAEAFITAAARSGVVQVEMEWEEESLGYAARVFPWEALLALATKDERRRVGTRNFAVVRVLKGGVQVKTAPTGPPGFAVSESARTAGFDFKTENAAIDEAFGNSLETLEAKSLAELRKEIADKKPKIVHLVLNSTETQAGISARDGECAEAEINEDLAEAVGSHGAEIVVFSSCFTGRRLAPLAVAKGARIAIGFHGEVMDTSIPVFFGAFYRAWEQGLGALGSLRAGLAANKSQADPSALGTVSLWSAADLISQGVKEKTQTATVTEFKGTGDGGVPRPADIKKALPVTCELEESLNYSVLHNSRGGLFKSQKFAVTKIKEGEMDPLEVTVRLDTGLDRIAECHFFAELPVKAGLVPLAPNVTLPLGSQLLRQRGETLLGTIEVKVSCGDVQVFHKLQPIKLLPCDEWRDDLIGRYFLPSFIFPRDPAVRKIITAAQPPLRALTDQPQAGFDGYQAGFCSNPDQALSLQTRAIWAALQEMRLDYVNPPPTYTTASQRLRTPEEILRAGRGTCIELALLLASCWEHVGIFPVLFLTSGHAFAGYWSSETARLDFIGGLAKLLDHAKNPDEAPGEKAFGGTSTSPKAEPWVFAEPHHLGAIREEVQERRLVPLEATFIPLQRSFREAMEESVRLLSDLRGSNEFDGMIDVQTAREKGVTPLAIITVGAAA